MKITSQTPSTTGASGVTGTDNASTVDQAMDDLEQMLEQIRQAQGGTGQQVDPTQLANGITNTLNKLKGPEEAGQLSPDQNARLQNALQTIGNMMQGNGAGPVSQPQSASGYPTDDKYDSSKIEGGKVGGHHKGGHVHATPPVDDTDPDANTLQTDTSNS